MNDFTRQLLLLLKKNARLSHSRLGVLMGVHRNTIARHIAQFEDEGLIRRYTIETAYEITEARTFMLIKLTRTSADVMRKLEAILNTNTVVVDYFRVRGHFSYLCFLKSFADGDINALVEELSEINDIYTEILDCV
jgi:DNA-binding Lrp family transcriptional regulator